MIQVHGDDNRMFVERQAHGRYGKRARRRMRWPRRRRRVVDDLRLLRGDDGIRGAPRGVRVDEFLDGRMGPLR